MSTYNSIDLDNILNAILVVEDVRNACLIQPADYDEAKGSDLRMMKIKEKIKSYFPVLIFSENYNIYQGTIVSKKSYDGEEVSFNKMGEILGYPCYQDFQNYNKNDDITYTIEINVGFENGHSQQIIANVCKSKEQESAFKKIAKKAEIVLKKPEYSEFFNTEGGIKNVAVFLRSEIPTKFLIDKLIANKSFDREEKDAIENILYNRGPRIEMDINNFKIGS